MDESAATSDGSVILDRLTELDSMLESNRIVRKLDTLVRRLVSWVEFSSSVGLPFCGGRDAGCAPARSHCSNFPCDPCTTLRTASQRRATTGGCGTASSGASRRVPSTTVGRRRSSGDARRDGIGKPGVSTRRAGDLTRLKPLTSGRRGNPATLPIATNSSSGFTESPRKATGAPDLAPGAGLPKRRPPRCIHYYG